MELLKKFEKNFKEGKQTPLGGRFEVNAPIAYDKIGDEDCIGLELEIEGRNIPTTGMLSNVVGAKSLSRWQQKADNSLRGEAAEYVFNMPTPAEEVPAMVEGFYNICRTAMDTRFRLSNRCSTHVHRNVSHYKVNQLTSIIALWTTFEEILIEYCGEQRKTNHFCLSAKDAVGTVEQWRRFLRNGNNDWPEHLKYSALNIRTLWQFGTFEFRCAPAYTTAEPVIYWTKLVDSVVREAIDTYFNPEKLAMDVSEIGPEEIFRNILARMSAEEDLKKFVELVPDFRASAIEGFRRAQPIIYELPWDKLLERIKADFVPNPFKKKPEPPRGRGIRFGDLRVPALEREDDDRPLMPRPEPERIQDEAGVELRRGADGQLHQIIVPQPAPEPVWRQDPRDQVNDWAQLINRRPE